MSVTITDELRLLIKAEAAQAIKETKAYKQEIKQVNTAHKNSVSIAGSVTKELMRTVGTYATVGAAIAGVTRYINEANSAYANAQGEARKFEITYAEVAKEAEDAADRWAKLFDYAESSAKQVLGSAGDIYTGMGMAAASALDMAEKTAYLGGALSKLNPQLGSASDATQSLITATTGEREALKRWGIIIQEAAVQTKLLERGQNDLTGAALLAAKAQAVIDIAYEQSPNALNAVSSATELAADTNRLLSESWKEHLELSGEVINKVFQPLKKELAEYIQNRNELIKAEKEAKEASADSIDTTLVEKYNKTADSAEKLASEYEELTGKVELSADEQDRLKSLIQEITSLVPSAATGFDAYGTAIGVSADKVRAFADAQREYGRLQLINQRYQLQQVQAENEKAYKQTKEEFDAAFAELSNRQADFQNSPAVNEAIAEALRLKDAGKAPKEIAAALDEVKHLIGGFNDDLVEGNGIYGSFGDEAAARNALSYLDTFLSGAEDRFGSVEKYLQEAKDEFMLKEGELAGFELVEEKINIINAALDALSGNFDEQIALLESEISKIPELSEAYAALKQQKDAGLIETDEQYVQELKRILDDFSSGAYTPDPPDTSSWDTFIEKLTSGLSMDEAIQLQVELSPIEDDSELGKLETQLNYYKDLIQGLWAGKGDYESIDAWGSALDALVLEYEAVKSSIDDIIAEEKQEARLTEIKAGLLTEEQKAIQDKNELEEEYNALLAEGKLTSEEVAALLKIQDELIKKASGEIELQNRAEELKKNLLTDEHKERANYAALLAELNTLEKEGLITEQEKFDLLEQQRQAIIEASGVSKDDQKVQELRNSLLTKEQQAKLELIAYEQEIRNLKSGIPLTEAEINELVAERSEELSEQLGVTKTWREEMEEGLTALKDDYFTIEKANDLISSSFKDMGEAFGSGENMLQASGKALGDYTSQLLGDLSTLAIGAGLRALVDGGMAALPMALALFALGGATGFASGALGSSGAGVDTQIKDALSEELKIRETLNDTLNDTLDIEMDLLRRKLDRNLISEEDYREGAQEINRQRNQGEAQSDALTLINSEISDFDTELSGMTGWDKFWSNRDEEILQQTEELKGLAEQINSAATAEELRQLLNELTAYGISIDSLPAFAKGGSFITSGPQPIMVGDNPGGRELVQITPLSSGTANPSGESQMHIHIHGNVYGIEDLYGKLKVAGMKIDRRNGRSAS